MGAVALWAGRGAPCKVKMVDFEVQTQRKTQVSFRSRTLEAQTSPAKMVS